VPPARRAADAARHALKTGTEQFDQFNPGRKLPPARGVLPLDERTQPGVAVRSLDSHGESSLHRPVHSERRQTAHEAPPPPTGSWSPRPRS
jgi:hypothetical protein